MLRDNLEESREVIDKSPRIREIAREYTRRNAWNLDPRMSKPLLELTYLYTDFDNGPTRPQYLCKEFEEGGRYAQELYRHGREVRAKLATIADDQGNVVLMRGEAPKRTMGKPWIETVRSYTSNPSVARSFVGESGDIEDLFNVDHTVIPPDSKVKIEKINISDIVDVIGVAWEEEFLVLNRSVIPEEALKRILENDKPFFARLLNRSRAMIRR
ncbi:MAG TPA: hypothetical protein VG917_03365 [Patescibacteria group bacterium]|nr:hypothetical protein [Patescibacteria group bacterium]